MSDSSLDESDMRDESLISEMANILASNRDESDVRDSSLESDSSRHDMTQIWETHLLNLTHLERSHSYRDESDISL